MIDSSDTRPAMRRVTVENRHHATLELMVHRYRDPKVPGQVASVRPDWDCVDCGFPEKDRRDPSHLHPVHGAR